MVFRKDPSAGSNRSKKNLNNSTNTAVLGIAKRQPPVTRSYSQNDVTREVREPPAEQKSKSPSRGNSANSRENSKSPSKSRAGGFMASNPAAVLLRKAKNARERKKQAEKEKRYKKILLSLKERNHRHHHNHHDQLSAISEEQLPQQSQDAPIRVPGVQTADAFVRASDLIGSDVVSVDDQQKKQRLQQQQQQQQPPWREILQQDLQQPVLHDPVPANETKEQRASTSVVRTFSQKKLILKKENQPPTTNAANTAAATETTTKGAAAAKKPMWKEVLDKQSGRKYYYHRLTRQTTWERPPEEQIIVKNQSNANKDKRYSSQEIKELIKKNPPADKKEEVTRLLTTMAPANTETVDRLVTTYEGKEDELLHQLKNLTESKPFDEPVPNPLRERTRTAASLKTSGSLRTGMSVYSGVSGKYSEQTPQIRNTSKRARGAQTVESIREGSVDDSSSFVTPRLRVPDSPSLSLPSHIPVPHRRRELRIEELSDRRTAETFDTRRPPRVRRVLRSHTAPALYKNDANNSGNIHNNTHASVTTSSAFDPYLGDNEDTDQDRETDSHANSAAMADSISALSEPDHDFRREAENEARRSALNEAIAKGDWDLAAALSDALRTAQVKSTRRKAPQQEEWMQSELDRFISENDWDAVAGYIAQVRRRSNSKDATSNPRKRFGAKSQLQHNELNSVSSWESSTSYESEDSAFTDEYSYGEVLPRRHKQEFAC